jgi:hypothetical protein
MNYNDTPPTGQENTLILYCRRCSYEEAPHQHAQAQPMHCPECHSRGVYQPLFFVRYREGVENEAARKVIEGNRRVH